MRRIHRRFSEWSRPVQPAGLDRVMRAALTAFTLISLAGETTAVIFWPRTTHWGFLKRSLFALVEASTALALLGLLTGLVWCATSHYAQRWPACALWIVCMLFLALAIGLMPAFA